MRYPMQSHGYMFGKHGIGQTRYKILYGLLCVISLFYAIIMLNLLTWDHHWFLQWGLYTLMLSNVSPNQVTIKVVIGYAMNHVEKCEWSRWNLSLSYNESMMSLGPSRKIDWEMHGRAIWLIVNHMKVNLTLVGEIKIVLNKVDTYPALSTIKTSSDKEINIKKLWGFCQILTFIQFG